MKNYLFGYGSLINKKSRSATGKTCNAYPVKLLDFRRGWNLIAPTMKMIGLGIFKNEDSVCNGVLIEIDESEIPAFDKREIEGSNFNYERVEIAPHKILGIEQITNGRIWTYIVARRQNPSWNFPIVQSYVDVILMGCLEYGEKFVLEFILGTTGWEHPWINDRNRPRYVRYIDASEHFEYLDSLLEKCIPSEYNHRKEIKE